MASKRCGKRTKEQPKSVGEVSVPASEPTKKRARKRKLNDDGDSSLARNQTSKPKPETSSASSEPVKKKARKALNKKERENLHEYLNAVDVSVLNDAVQQKISEQCLSGSFKSFVDVLYTNEVFQDILLHHRIRFSQLYMESKKGVDPFVRFQLKWHEHCSVFLLARSYPLTAINLNESAQHSVAALRMQWLDFCDINGLPVPESNVVMMTISTAIYELLLKQTESFKNSLTTNTTKLLPPPSATDGDDVYFRFGGAALCDMLHLRYQQIKSCTDMQRDKLSQEITILQAMNIKDKSVLPQYLQYRDRGFMYFPDVSFIPFLRTVDEIVKKCVNMNTLEQDGIDVIKVR